MSERPILFNADMVRAVLDGRKTQTRRIMRVQPSADFSPMNLGLETDFTARWYTPGVVDKDGYLQSSNKQVFGVASEDEGYTCPFGAVGDRLWVRESFYEHGRWQGGGYDPEDSYFVSDKQVLYPADGIQRPAERKREDFWRSRPSIHMPRWASRITLEITGVRVERLHAITLGDICKELGCGLYDFRPATYGFKVWEELWKSIYGADSWQANPWVWVIEFKRVEGE